ncbi:Opacity protein [Palleronia marisminoris]|uniref:Outer membrane protein beta-barrel domain-containing protein n=1 Tax=Palleronia marisminoris TaxID=315423 RepID=A0A1Y5T9M1_9RHOB|nr:outer membrane beta-barrel protein [Palleronia marisminoris]SFH16323.1 Opacity protein [Palleronia marisminoris]SLN55403.1 hypothetical protein PAM7066_02644 [Palleronia marisminoris]
MKTICLLAAAVLAAGSAHAGGVTAPALDPQPQPQPQPAPIPVSQLDWTGGYVGASLGYGDVDAEIVEPLDLDASGAIGGVFAGYQHDFGSFVLGAELDANLANLDVDVDAIDLDGVDISVDRLHRLKVRAGYDAGRALVYGVAGAAYGNLHVEVDDLDGLSGEDDASDWGYVVGAGADVLVSDRVSIGGEVLYHKFDALADADELGAEQGLDAEVITFQARVAYRF